MSNYIIVLKHLEVPTKVVPYLRVLTLKIAFKEKILDTPSGFPRSEGRPGLDLRLGEASTWGGGGFPSANNNLCKVGLLIGHPGHSRSVSQEYLLPL